MEGVGKIWGKLGKVWKDLKEFGGLYKELKEFGRNWGLFDPLDIHRGLKTLSIRLRLFRHLTLLIALKTLSIGC